MYFSSVVTYKFDSSFIKYNDMFQFLFSNARSPELWDEKKDDRENESSVISVLDKEWLAS